MSKRLLTDDAIAAIISPYRGAIPKALRKMPLFTLEKEVSEAQAKHTEQRERQKIGEWLAMDAGIIEDQHSDSSIEEGIAKLRQGLAPTESGQWPESEVG